MLTAPSSSSSLATTDRTSTSEKSKSEDSTSSNPYEPQVQPDGTHRIRLLDPQIEALEDSDTRILAFLGGTGAGKTWLGPLKIHKRMREHPGCRSMAIGMQYERHVQNVMQKALIDYFTAIGEQFKLVTGRRIVIPRLGNAEVIFGSAEKPESLEGPHLDGIAWMDEAGYMSYFAYEVARRRTAYHGAQVYISTIPYLPNWLKKEVYEPALAGEKTIKVIRARSIDNPNYPIDEIEYAKANWRPEKFATIFLGEFSRPVGMIYPEPSDEEMVFDWEDDFPQGIPEDWPCFAGHDWGMTAPTTGTWGRLDVDNDILYVVAEYERSGLTLEDHLYEWSALGLTDIDQAWGDPEDPDRIETLRRRQYPIEKANNAINYGIDRVYERMVGRSIDYRGRPSRQLRIARDCKTLFAYRGSYVWDHDPKDEDELLDKPKKPQEAEHLMDSLRYLCTGVYDEGYSRLGGGVVETGQRWRAA